MNSTHLIDKCSYGEDIVTRSAQSGQWNARSMHIQDLFNKHRTTFSFEFFPPKNEQAARALFDNMRELEQLRPTFVSVTYGAGGSTRKLTRDLVARISAETSLDPVPHLTCVSQTALEMSEILEQYARHGVSNILALRGDPPSGCDYNPEDDTFKDGRDKTRPCRLSFRSVRR